MTTQQALDRIGEKLKPVPGPPNWVPPAMAELIARIEAVKRR